MVFDKNLETLTNALNISDKLSGEEFNKNPIIVDAYIKIYGKEEYHSCLSTKHYNDMNAFYSITLSIENEIANRKIPTTTAKSYAEKITDDIVKNHSIFHIVGVAINRNEIEYAEELIGLLSEDSPVSSSYHGYRLLLKYYAQQSDINNFKKYLKLSRPIKHPKSQVIEAKDMMLANYCELHGIKEGLELCEKKIFGINRCMSLLDKKVKKFSITEIDDTLQKHPVFLEYEINAKAILYVKRLQSNKCKIINSAEFETTLNEISKVDKSIKKEGVRLKDCLLYNLGMATQSKSQITSCKKMITAPFLKKELNYHLS